MQSIRLSILFCFFFFSSRRRHTRYWRDWSSDVCSSDLSITEHEGRIIQSRSEESIIQEVEDIRDKVKGFTDRKSTRLNSSHANISYAVFCLKKKKRIKQR